MAHHDLSTERRNVLKALKNRQGSPLREIHQAVVEVEDSRFVFSPPHGDGWNDERWAVRDHLHALKDEGLAWHDENPYPWYLTDKGKRVADSM